MPRRRRDPGRNGGLRLRPAPKGRTVDPAALSDSRSLLGDAPRRADLLIEHLHRIQDAYGRLEDRHLVALAAEMRLTTAEVYEVATFYHHFDVVKQGDAAPPAVTVRVCDSIACSLAGAEPLLDALRARLGDRIRVIPAPCVGRCEQAPVAVAGRNPIAQATVEAVEETILAE